MAGQISALQNPSSMCHHQMSLMKLVLCHLLDRACNKDLWHLYFRVDSIALKDHAHKKNLLTNIPRPSSHCYGCREL